MLCRFFFFNESATTEIYTYLHTLSLHDALPISARNCSCVGWVWASAKPVARRHLSRWFRTITRPISAAAPLPCSISPHPSGWPLARWQVRSEEHTSELQSLMRISYAVFCLKKKINYTIIKKRTYHTQNNK